MLLTRSRANWISAAPASAPRCNGRRRLSSHRVSGARSGSCPGSSSRTRPTIWLVARSAAKSPRRSRSRAEHPRRTTRHHSSDDGLGFARETPLHDFGHRGVLEAATHGFHALDELQVRHFRVQLRRQRADRIALGDGRAQARTPGQVAQELAASRRPPFDQHGDLRLLLEVRTQRPDERVGAPRRHDTEEARRLLVNRRSVYALIRAWFSRTALAPIRGFASIETRAHGACTVRKSSLFSATPPPGFEPGTCGLEVRCSIQLSYGGVARKLTSGGGRACPGGRVPPSGARPSPPAARWRARRGGSSRRRPARRATPRRAAGPGRA